MLKRFWSVLPKQIMAGEPTERYRQEYTDKHRAESLLKAAVNNPGAHFRDGQWEAIDALVNHRRKLMVVQRTGWGKSSVYFISTRILRDRGAGPTVIVSPLLALMRNQISAASQLKIRAEAINSSNQEDWPGIQQDLLEDQIDAVLISPERLANERFVEETLLPIADRIGLLVVDEVHCISDWGHDFRPDYRRLSNVLGKIPPNTPVLGTTATANDRVIKDVKAQLGDIGIQRGPLTRDSLVLQTLRLPNKASRLAWLAQHISSLPGTGIVYVLTRRDCDQVADWLNQRKIEACAYYSGVGSGELGGSSQHRQYLEDLLLENKVKVLVATTALGMGYDKPDLGFVIHYQAPSSAVAYYQQVGRAGRAIRKAYGVLMSGTEDEEIHEYFRRRAFPSEEEVNSILNVLAKHDGLSSFELQRFVNLRRNRIDSALKFLHVQNPAPVIKEREKWLRSPVRFRMDHKQIRHLTRQRETEWKEIQRYINSKRCLMAYLQNALDDPEIKRCGRCSVCLGKPVLPEDVDESLVKAAARFFRRTEIRLKSRKRASEGRALSRWNDPGWGALVAKGKHAGHFEDELVDAAAKMIQQRWRPSPAPEWVTCVPSNNRPTLVPDFAKRLATRLGLPFLDAIRKIRDNEPQKMQENSFHQWRNLQGAFKVSARRIPGSPVLLVDDIVDSGATVTTLAALLWEAGSGQVYPFALASSAEG